MTHFYIGDINIENGGAWYKLPDSDNWQQDYATVLSVTDCTNLIDDVQSDSLWVIESGSIYMPWGSDNMASILDTIGATLLDNGNIDDNGQLLEVGTKEHWLCFAMACHAYSGIDRDCIGGESWISDDPHCVTNNPERFDIDIIEGGTLADYIRDNWGMAVV